MSELSPIALEMEGRHDLFGVDAPNIEDVLAQVRSFVNIFKAVDESLSDRGRDRIEWLMTATSMSSPVRIELTPYFKNEQQEVADNNSAKEFFRLIETAFQQILGGDATPVAGFPLSAVKEFENVRWQTDNGSVRRSTLDLGKHGSKRGKRRYTVDSENSALLAKTLREQKRTLVGPKGPTRHGSTKPGVIKGVVAGMHSTEKELFVLHVRNYVDGEIIRCRVRHDAFLEQNDNSTVTVPRHGVHVAVHGKIYYTASGEISSVTADRVEFTHSS